MTEPITIREAHLDDIPAIVALLADDPLGRTREDPADLAAYREAFDEIAAQSGNMVLVAQAGGAVVGCLQLTIIPGLARSGMRRGQIEGVRIAVGQRGQRLGERLMAEAIERARAAGCGLVQLTTDRSRPDAHRFYERLGFTASHLGMKLML
ncbi:MAG TPA: GNAT family N-acetyltransferase [Stellaceae bacterium]